MANLAAKARKVMDETDRLLTIFKPREGLLAGSLYIARTRCGRKGCKCMTSDYRHENDCLSFVEAGKSRTRTVPEDLLKSICEQTAAYRAAKVQRRKIAKAAHDLLKSIDDTIAIAAGRGQKSLLTALTKNKGGAK